MTFRERLFVISLLSAVTLLVSLDLLTDSAEGVPSWHLAFEGLAGLLALMGVFYFLKDSLHMKHKLSDSVDENRKLKQESDEWKLMAHKHIQGLSHSIDEQLSKWNLSSAEKEVALLLLKGLSLKEIADIRKTTEKTARVQSIAIYSKSGLSGRSELAAFFLEDLLLPKT